MPREGGYVHKAGPFPGRPNVVAVMATLTGGHWSPGDQRDQVTQYRGDSVIGLWRIVGVDVMATASRSPLLLLSPHGSAPLFAEGDIITLGDAIYSQIELRHSTLPIESTSAIAIGPDALNAIARVEGGAITRVIVFHGYDDTLPRAERQSAVWRGEEYVVTLKHRPDEPVELRLNGTPKVSLARLIDTLTPTRGFVLGSGQEMLFHAPRPPRGRYRDETRQTFEPSVDLAHGSIRVILHQADPERIPLFVRPNDPIRLFVEALHAASQRDERRLLSLLGRRAFSVNKLLRDLRNIAMSGAEDGAIAVSGGGFGEFRIDGTVGMWLKELAEQPARRVLRSGELYAADSHRNWCKVLVEGTSTEDWTLRFSSELKAKVKKLMFRAVAVSFDTRATDETRGGAGILREIGPNA